MNCLPVADGEALQLRATGNDERPPHPLAVDHAHVGAPGRADDDQLGAGLHFAVAGPRVHAIGDDNLIAIRGGVDPRLNGRLVAGNVDDAGGSVGCQQQPGSDAEPRRDLPSTHDE